MFKRFVSIRSEDMSKSDNGLTRLRLLASTDDPIDMGGWREVLSHADGAIDLRTATALLVNHDPNRIAGVLRSCAPDGKRMSVEADLDESAQMESGMTVKRAVDIGAMRSASVGYTYKREDCQYDEQSRTVTVRKWRLLELSLTPTPADAECGIRSMPFDLDNNPAPVADTTKERHMADPIVNPVAPVDPAPAILAEQRQVAELARSLKLDPVEFAGKPLAAAKDAMLAEVAKRAAAEHKAPAHAIEVTSEDADKQLDAVVDAYGARVFGAAPKQGNPFAGLGLRDIGRKWAQRVGLINTGDWSTRDAAEYVIGKRDAANVTMASFANFVTANVITKIVAKGFEAAAANVVYPRITERQLVPDFKQFRIGGLGTANLTETPENVAFPELAKSEGYYNSVAKNWGGTLSLTLQAVVSDDTGEFDRSLRQAGTIAQKTIDRRVIQKFLRGIATTDASTWTSNTTSGCTIVYSTADQIAAARANIYRASVGMMNKIGLDGNPLGTMPRFLLCGPTNGLFARGLVQNVGGQIVANSGDLELVVSPWLEATTITGNSSTSYYLLADPMATTGIVLSMVQGFEAIRVQEYDAGAVDARKWKMSLPFEADLFWATNAAGTSIIPGAQQATT